MELNSNLKLLKAWYLASLRKKAVEAKNALSPSALMDADRKVIEKLAISKVARKVLPATAKYEAQTRIKNCLMAAIGLTVVAALLTISGLAPFWVTSLLLTAVVAFAGAAFHWFSSDYVPPLDALWRLASVRSSDNNPDLAKTVDTLTQKLDELEEGEGIIVDAAPDGLCCINSSYSITAINSTLSAMLGLGAHHIGTVNLVDCAIAEDQQKLRAALERTKDNNSSERLDMRFLTHLGQAIDLRISLDWSASNELFFVSAADISDQKLLERARAEYISTMGHDIKIPLTAVLLSLESLSGKEGDVPRTQRIVARSEANLERLIALIDELLEYERSTTSGKLPLKYESVNVGELVSDAVSTVAPQAETKNIAVNVTAPDITIRADKKRLARVLVNLLSNAIKFSPEQSEINVSATVNNHMVDFVVRDKGPGIPEKYRQLIFERYERMPDSTDIEGTGLGLAICKTIVDSHKGIIGVKPAPGGGSQFWFNVPIGNE